MGKHGFIPPADFLAKLRPTDKQDLLSVGTRQESKKNEIIFQAGSPGDNVYFLVSGRAKIYQLAHTSAKEVILWFCFPGEMFGLAEVCRQEKRGVYARACTDSELLKISQSDFKDFIRTHSDAAWLTIDLLSCRMRVLGDMLLNLAADDVNSRVIKLLLRLTAYYGKTIDNETYLDINLTHQEMADMIGASRQTVSSILGDLKKQDILFIKNQCIHIKSTESLENMIDHRASTVSFTPATQM